MKMEPHPSRRSPMSEGLWQRPPAPPFDPDVEPKSADFEAQKRYMQRKVGEKMLPPYSGEDVTCPKCGHAGAHTTFLDHGECQHSAGPGRVVILGVEPNERLHRECDNCSYAWDEAIVSEHP